MRGALPTQREKTLTDRQMSSLSLIAAGILKDLYKPQPENFEI